MNTLKPAQRFDAPPANEPLESLQPRQQYADAVVLNDDIDEKRPVISEQRSKLMPLLVCATVLLVIAALWQWVDWLLQSWQQSLLAGIFSSVLTAVLLSLLLIVSWREWKLWRRLKLNRKWQQQATRIADSVQFGEAQPLCTQIIAALPQQTGLQAAVVQWQQSVTAEHSDHEQLQLFQQTVLGVADKQARQIIWRASSDTSLAVAVSPFALADMLLVLWRSSRMLRELAVLYGAPVGQLRSLAMLKRALAALLWAGGSEMALDMASDLISSELTAKVSARAGQGIIAGLLVARLGNLAQQQLRPLPLQSTQKISITELTKALAARFKKKDDTTTQTL